MHYVEATQQIVPPGHFSAPRDYQEYEKQSIHGKLLRSLIEFRGCKTIVEIGVSCAVTTHQLCEAAKVTKGHVFGFDMWDVHGLWRQILPFGSRDFCQTLLETLGYNNFTLTQINSHEPTFPCLLKEMTGGKIDFAFIDACHSYQGIENDFKAVYPLISNDGIIAFHDTGIIDGCREFMLDLRTKYNDGTFDIIDIFSHIDDYGVSLLCKRTLYNKERQINNICGSISTAEEIIKKEKEWYKSQIA